MKIVHSSYDPETGLHVVAFTGERLEQQLLVGSDLRCAGYRFRVESWVAQHLDAPVPSIVARLSSEDTPQVGMVVHPAGDPLTDEELAAALQHLLMIPRMLKAVDAQGVFRRLQTVAATEDPTVRFAATIVENVAIQLCRLILPTDHSLQEAERFKAELLRAC